MLNKKYNYYKNTLYNDLLETRKSHVEKKSEKRLGR